MQSEGFRNILVVNPYGIGDALFTTPIIRSLKENFPSSGIDVLLGSRTKEVFEYNPDVVDIIVFDKGEFDKVGFIKKMGLLSEVFRKLKNKGYDLMVDLSNAPEYGFFGKFLLRVPVRVGFDYKKRGRFLTKKVPLKGFEGKHIVEFYLDLLRKLEITVTDNNLHMYITDGQLRWAEDFLVKNNIKVSGIVVGIIPGGGESWGRDSYLKRWPAENFAKVSKLLTDKFDAKVLLFGSKDETGICKEISDFLDGRVVDTSGKLSICELAALFKKCSLIICNDGGPLHIAKSQNVNTISIFGPVDSMVYGPFPRTDRDVVLEAALNCRPCYKNFKMLDCKTKECLKSISPEMVFEEVKSLIGINGKCP
jgi:heptosyltransferase-2